MVIDIWQGYDEEPRRTGAPAAAGIVCDGRAVQAARREYWLRRPSNGAAASGGVRAEVDAALAKLKN